jgi:hypothetical protein
VLLAERGSANGTSNSGAHDPSEAWMVGAGWRAEKVRPAPGGEPAAREPGLGTGRGGDVTGVASSYFVQREVAVAGAARGSPSEIQTFGSACDWRFTKR